MNVAYYGKEGGAWALTEGGSHAVARSADELCIGNSQFGRQADGSFAVQLLEKTSPFGRALRGGIRVMPEVWSDTTFALDSAGRHRWTPLALGARATVEIERPRKARWSGRAYVDTNAGSEPLERGFHAWNWSRSSGPDATHVVYDVRGRDGSNASIRKTFHPDGSHEPLTGIELRPLARTQWGVQRWVPSDAGTTPRVMRCLEDTPFYARTLAATTLRGERTHLMHETVDMDRFKRAWVQFLIPFRMRRNA